AGELGGLALVRNAVRQGRADRERKEEATRLGLDRPIAQHPFIDPSRCIGCGTCVQVCPEGDVLGIVRGTAVVVNGLRCIGIAHCEKACPVGAITVGVGDKPRPDVPLLSEGLETTVPGIYVAGELGGLALVRNAVRQGREVVERISDCRGAEPAQEGVVDLAIVGAGPAGLSAALTARAAGLSFEVLEQEKSFGGTVLNYPRRKLVLTEPVELPPFGALERREYLKEELLEFFSSMVEQTELPVSFGRRVREVERVNGHFELRTDASTTRARHVLLSLGRRGNPRRLGVPGEESSKVMYRLIDAESYSGERILVVGGGDSAAEAVIGLARQQENRVWLSYRKEKLVRLKQKNLDKIDRLIEAGRVEPLFSSNVLEIRPESVLLAVEGEGEVEIPNDYVFVFAGGEPPYKFLRSMGVRFPGDAEEPAAAARTAAAGR
ncbi:MAG: NAD(P)-binding domain-containing protein, partial [Thermoanaerobaculia bacterium]|nr:NAD(P)-binding domain-containing protein [Thermoanaerobaculia bacterium]